MHDRLMSLFFPFASFNASAASVDYNNSAIIAPHSKVEEVAVRETQSMRCCAQDADECTKRALLLVGCMMSCEFV